MEISNSISALIGGIAGAAISSLIAAYSSHKSLKQAAKDKLISSAYDAAIAEYSASVEVFKINPNGYVISAFSDHLVYHLAFIQGVSRGNEFIELNDKSILSAVNRASELSSLRRKADNAAGL